MPDRINDLLGIDTEDPIQALAIKLVDSDHRLLRRLVELRKAKGLTQGEVGRRMGVTQAAVSTFERLEADPHLSTVRRYALAVQALIEHSVTDSTARPPRRDDLVRTSGHETEPGLHNVRVRSSRSRRVMIAGGL